MLTPRERLAAIISLAEKKKDEVEPASVVKTRQAWRWTGMLGGAIVGANTAVKQGGAQTAVRDVIKGSEVANRYHDEDVAHELKKAQKRGTEPPAWTRPSAPVDSLPSTRADLITDSRSGLLRNSRGPIIDITPEVSPAPARIPEVAPAPKAPKVPFGTKAKYLADDALHGTKKFLTRHSIGRNAAIGGLIGIGVGNYIGGVAGRELHRAQQANAKKAAETRRQKQVTEIAKTHAMAKAIMQNMNRNNQLSARDELSAIINFRSQERDNDHSGTAKKIAIGAAALGVAGGGIYAANKFGRAVHGLAKSGGKVFGKAEEAVGRVGESIKDAREHAEAVGDYIHSKVPAAESYIAANLPKVEDAAMKAKDVVTTVHKGLQPVRDYSAIYRAGREGVFAAPKMLSNPRKWLSNVKAGWAEGRHGAAPKMDEFYRDPERMAKVQPHIDRWVGRFKKLKESMRKRGLSSEDTSRAYRSMPMMMSARDELSRIINLEEEYDPTQFFPTYPNKHVSYVKGTKPADVWSRIKERNPKAYEALRAYSGRRHEAYQNSLSAREELDEIRFMYTWSDDPLKVEATGGWDVAKARLKDDEGGFMDENIARDKKRGVLNAIKRLGGRPKLNPYLYHDKAGYSAAFKKAHPHWETNSTGMFSAREELEVIRFGFLGSKMPAETASKLRSAARKYETPYFSGSFGPGTQQDERVRLPVKHLADRLALRKQRKISDEIWKKTPQAQSPKREDTGYWSARDQLNTILLAVDPRPRNSLGMFGSDEPGAPDPRSMSLTYGRAAGLGATAGAAGVAGGMGMKAMIDKLKAMKKK